MPGRDDVVRTLLCAALALAYEHGADSLVAAEAKHGVLIYGHGVVQVRL